MDDRGGVVTAITAAIGVLTLAIGGWALLAPRSFYEQIALFDPYNEHFLHDVGAFQIGLGAALLLALWVPDGLQVALGGYAVGGVAHTVAHAIDADLGGRTADVPSIAALTLLAVAAYALRWRALRRRQAGRPLRRLT
jgi:hypothetical protein